MRGTWGTETSKYPEEEKSTEISRVVASESERGQTKSSNTLGVRTRISISKDSRSMLESIHQRKWKSCRRNLRKVSRIQSTYRHVESVGKTGGPPSKPKYYLMTDSGEVLWRKGEKNPGRGVKRTWNLMFTSTQSTLRCDVVPFVEWSGELLYVARLSSKGMEPQRNRVWKAR